MKRKRRVVHYNSNRLTEVNDFPVDFVEMIEGSRVRSRN